MSLRSKLDLFHAAQTKGKKKKSEAKEAALLALNCLGGHLKNSTKLHEAGLDYCDYLYCGSEYEGTSVRQRTWRFDALTVFPLNNDLWRMVRAMNEMHFECTRYKCIANPEKEKTSSSDQLYNKYAVSREHPDFPGASDALSSSAAHPRAGPSPLRQMEMLASLASFLPPWGNLSSWRELNPTGIIEKVHGEVKNIFRTFSRGRYSVDIMDLPSVGCDIPIIIIDQQNNGQIVCKINLMVGMQWESRDFSRYGEAQENVWTENLAPVERCAMKKINAPGECRKKVYTILEAIGKSPSENPLSIFPSYVFKNVIFHCKDKGDWSEESLEERFIDALIFLRDCMRKRFMARFYDISTRANVLDLFWRDLDDNERRLTRIIESKNFEVLLR